MEMEIQARFSFPANREAEEGEITMATMKCKSCEHEFEADANTAVCPNCGGNLTEENIKHPNDCDSADDAVELRTAGTAAAESADHEGKYRTAGTADAESADHAGKYRTAGTADAEPAEHAGKLHAAGAADATEFLHGMRGKASARNEILHMLRKTYSCFTAQ